MNRKFVTGCVGLLAIGTVVAGCGGDKTQLKDAPVGNVDDAPVLVMTNADQFPNVSFRCNGSTGLYTTTRGGDAFTVESNDPKCPGYNAQLPSYVG